MSRQYIKQLNNQNFVFPNKGLAEYDIELIQDLNENSISGTVTNFTATTVSSSSVDFSFDYVWYKNNAEPFIKENGDISILSVHAMPPANLYYKPWRLVTDVSSSSTTGATYSGTCTFTVTPTQLQSSSFYNGSFYFEVRFIGHRAIFPVCAEYVISTLPTPTPTPTATPTPTPTPTPTSTPTPTVSIYKSGATLNVTDTGWIKYDTIYGSTYQYLSSYGTNTITDCVNCATFAQGIPFADLASFTVTNCGNSC